MAVSASDIEFRFSTTTGPGDSTSGTAATSLGDFMSTTQITTATLHNLFDVISGSENAALDVEYRCIFVTNTNGADTWSNVKVWIQDEVSGGATAAIGIDPIGVVAGTSASQQAEEINAEGTTPSTPTFSAPTDETSGISIGNMAAGTCQAIWIRRTANDTGSVSNDGVTIRVSGDA